MDKKDQFAILKNELATFLKERDWESYHNRPKNIVMSIAIEAAELMELFQWNNLSAPEVLADKELLTRVQDELADVLIYCISLARALDLDLFECISSKMACNKERFPVK